MKLGIIGLPQSGKSTVFEALTKNFVQSAHGDVRLGTVRVPDNRLDVLNEMYKPRKTIYAQVEYILSPFQDQKSGKNRTQTVSPQLRDCDAFLHVVRNFRGPGFDSPRPPKDFFDLDQELIFADLVVVETRLERIGLDKKRGRKVNQDEIALLEACLETLENDIPLRRRDDLAGAQALRGYAFVSAKPTLVLFNNEDEDEKLPDAEPVTSAEACMVVRGKLEHELARLSDEEAGDFLSAYGIVESAMDRVIRRSYELLGLISFFTIGKDEVRAWTIRKNTPAVDAAGAVHSDMKKGFIRAEVLAYEDLMAAGTYAEAKRQGKVRLEGKSHIVQDGEIVNFRFNV
ncbi:MAG: redox-regulated ATPase YchF [Deltaproteobacteria bacterium]|nr:redox-regulated ATPase YchF [Deltaproteobacteria bacterium]